MLEKALICSHVQHNYTLQNIMLKKNTDIERTVKFRPSSLLSVITMGNFLTNRGQLPQHISLHTPAIAITSAI